MDNDWVTRLRDELVELAGRVEKLQAFLWGPVFNGLPAVDRTLLIVQLGHMEAYAATLERRMVRTMAAAKEPR